MYHSLSILPKIPLASSNTTWERTEKWRRKLLTLTNPTLAWFCFEIRFFFPFFPLHSSELFFLIIIIFTHVFVCQFWLCRFFLSWEKHFHSDFSALFLLLFFCFIEHELSSNEELYQEVRETHIESSRSTRTSHSMTYRHTFLICK